MKRIYQLSFVLLVTLLFSQCENEEKISKSPEELNILSEAESYGIVRSEEFQSYVSLRFHFIDLIYIAIQKGHDLETLKKVTIESINTEKNTQFFSVVFGSKQKGLEYINSLEMSRVALYDKYPVLYEVSSQMKSPEVSANFVNMFYDNLETISKERFVIQKVSKSRVNDPHEYSITCGSYWKQIKLIGCSGVCGLATPVVGPGAFLCVWGCWCTLCNDNSAVAEMMC